MTNHLELNSMSEETKNQIFKTEATKAFGIIKVEIRKLKERIDKLEKADEKRNLQER